MCFKPFRMAPDKAFLVIPILFGVAFLATQLNFIFMV